MAPVLSFIVGSLLACRALAEPFEKLFSTPEGRSTSAEDQELMLTTI
jgi:hypothetical protein